MSWLSAKAALTLLLLVYGAQAKGIRPRHGASGESRERVLVEDDEAWTRYAMEEINSICKFPQEI